jgi:hypothetical membrane protein
VRNWVVVSSIIAPVALVGGWSVAATRQPSTYDSVRDTISALAARGATDRWIMTTALAVVGLCYIVTACGSTDFGALARWLLGTGGAATFAVSLLPQPNAGHVPAASVGFALLAIWPAFSVAAPRRVGITITIVLLALLTWLVVELSSRGLLGLSERVLAGAEALCPLALVALGLLRPVSTGPTLHDDHVDGAGGI